MPEDLPEIGLSAGIENLDKFAQDAKKVQDAYRQMAEAEAQVQKASEQQVAATERAGQAWQDTAGQAQAAAAAWADAADAMAAAQGGVGEEAQEQIEQLSWASQQMEDIFGGVEEELAQSKSELAQWGQALDQEAAAATNAQQANAMLQRSYEMLGRVSPEIVDMLQDMEREWIDQGGAVEEFADTIEQVFGEAVDQIEAGAGKATTAMDRMLTLFSLGALQQVSGTIGRAGDQLLGLAKDATMTAARIEELDMVLGNMAVQNDLSAQALREQVQAVKDQGIQSSVAYNLVTQFVQANLDLAQASKLARVAQDAAVISMEDSSQALAGLLHGIMTLQPEVLRYRGIIVDLQGDYQRWADENNRTVQSMTGAEKQAVALQSVIDQGGAIFGTYESAMGSASKQLRSFTRYIEELKEEFGNALLPVLTEGVFTAKDLIKQLMGLPEPIKASLATTTALTGALLKGTSSMVSIGSQAAMLAFAMKELGVATQFASLSFLGPVGLIAGLAIATAAVFSYAKAQEEAHQQEAASIVTASESYEGYLKALDDAGLGSYALSESLYEVAKAGEEAASGVDALTLSVANRELQEGLSKILRAGGPRRVVTDPGAQYEKTTEALKEYISTLDEAGLLVAQNEEQMIALFEAMGFGQKTAEGLAARTIALADAEADLRQMTEWAETAVDVWAERVQEARSVLGDWHREMRDSIDTFRDATIGQYELTKGMYQMAQAALMADPAVEALTEQIIKLIEKGGEGAAIQWSVQRLVDITRDAEEEIGDLRERAREEQERVQERYNDAIESLEKGHTERRADIQADMAEVHQDLLDDMAKAEEDYQASRVAIAEEYAQEIADAEAKYAQDRADLYDDFLKGMADAERDFAQDVEDARQDLARDIEDIERKLAQKLVDLEEKYYQDREELAQEYGQRRQSIEEKFAQQRQDIEKKYQLEPEAAGFDEQREALLEELERVRKAYAGTGMDPIAREQQIMAQLEELKEAELAALDERKEAELAELEAWLDEEQAVQDAAYQEALDKQIEAAEQQAVERVIQYQRQMQDLEQALGQEREERKRRYNEQLADLEEAHRRELDEMARANQERLVALDDQLVQERIRLEESAQQRRDALAEQLADELDAYRERKSNLDAALVEDKQIIGERLQEATQTVIDEADEQTAQLKAAWERVSPAVASAIDILRYQTIQPRMHAITEDVIGEVARMMQALQQLGFIGNSPAPWWMSMGESWGQGLEAGLDLDKILEQQVAAFGKFKVDAEDILEVGSPSKWAERMGESVSDGFSNRAELTPTMGDFALDAFEAELPSVPDQDIAIHPFFGPLPAVDGQDMDLNALMGELPNVAAQDMALQPFLDGMPEIPAQEVSLVPNMLDVESLAAQFQVQAPTPPSMAAGATGTSVDRSRTANLQVDAHYTQYQSERSLRQDLDGIRMLMGY